MARPRMCELTTFRLGGPCAGFTSCETPAEVVAAWRDMRASGKTMLLIGGGSNLLVADAGVDAHVIRYQSDHPGIISWRGGMLHASCGMPLDLLAGWAADNGVGGLLFGSGIPGTLGGAIAGNAGAFGEQIGDLLLKARVLLPDGRDVIVDHAGFDFGYRKSRASAGGWIILEAWLKAEAGDRSAGQSRRDEILALRAAKHPDWRRVATAGSFFKNVEPTSAAGRRQAAGWFLEQAGAMTMRVGGAHTFERHANIIVADPGSTSEDVRELTGRMAAAVADKFGIRLEPEVRLIGF